MKETINTFFKNRTIEYVCKKLEESHERHYNKIV